MNVDEFLNLEKKAAGFMVAVRGRYAPTFIHAADTDDVGRDAAITEAERLLEMDGGGRALILQIVAVVDQAPPKLPPAEVRHISTADDPDFREVEGASSDEARPASLVVKLHGIYMRRDGGIVGIQRFTPDGVIATQDNGDVVYADTGRANYLDADDAPHDLVREIVVGEGWNTWNGGVMLAQGDVMVDIVTRDGAAFNYIVRGAKAFALRWPHIGAPDDILAYRIAAAAAEPSQTIGEALEIAAKRDDPPFKPGDPVRVTEPGGYVFDAVVNRCEKLKGEWNVSFVGGGHRYARFVELAPREV